jgi:ketosteroid isomerase-like protein
MEHPQADRARSVLAEVSGGNLDALDDQVTDDIVWHVGGEHPLSGDYRGRKAVMDYHRRVAELTGGSLRLEPIDVLASDRHLGIFLKAAAGGEGPTIDTTMVEAIRLDQDGKWAEFWGLADDQAGVDAFWKEVAK